MNVFMGDGIDVILHEFGHVLGLPDRYWEYRNLSNCSDEQESLEIDMMSGTVPGSQWLPSDWTEMSTNYPHKH